MEKTLIGPQLRQLRRERGQTQAEMAQALGVSTAYVNLLENNQRSLSVKMLMALSTAYGVDWRDLMKDDSAHRLANLRDVSRDPIFGDDVPDIQELRAALDHAPKLVEQFLSLYRSHRAALDKMMQLGSEASAGDLLRSAPETVIHDFFRDHSNYFHDLEKAAENLRDSEPFGSDDVYYMLKRRLQERHGTQVEMLPVGKMQDTLRYHDESAGIVYLSEVLDYQNRSFQLAHTLCLIEFAVTLDKLTRDSGVMSEREITRCQVELANYFAAAYLMPYKAFYKAAEDTRYDVDMLAAMFGVSFEQACHRLTTLQRRGCRGVPFFFLRVDKAGNVTKRFNSTSFTLAEYGGACPVWNIHTSFRTPGIIIPQFVELPDGERYFTISRTTERPAFSSQTQDRRLALALGCELKHAPKIGYAQSFNLENEALFSPIGINCHLCPRQACSQRAHQPILVDLPIDTRRRGNTRYES
ncbi:short-chain fatty acyl-CoA regulator family protein [Tepidamorphus sp. 3E244]|uniref:helix-turn-helix domain-containing protein n=1 Tax=Tepidamorphus sp. 3E244 TaxID=3385498 RepID=UPI0038FCE598